MQKLEAKICKNMQYQTCKKYAQYAQMKYAKYMFICYYIQKYANHKYYNVHIYAKKYAEICKTEYAQICISKICIIS